MCDCVLYSRWHNCSTAIMMSSCTLQWLLEAETSNLIGNQGPSHCAYKLSWPHIWPLNLPNLKLQLERHWVQRSKVGLWEGLLWYYRTQPERPFWFLLQCLKSLQTGVDHSYVHTKQIPSKVYSVECVGCVGCVECEGVTVCTITDVAKHQLTCSGQWWSKRSPR